MSLFIARRQLISAISRGAFKSNLINSGKIVSSQFLLNKSFSSSAITKNLPQVKQALLNKLQDELKIENEGPVLISKEDSDFLKENNFSISHNQGEKIVTLTKTLPDNNKLHVYFDCTELNDIQANAPGPERFENEQEDAELDEEEFDDQLENSLLNVNIIVENSATNQSLVVHSFLSFDEMVFFPQSFQIIKDAELALSLAAESQQIKLSKYNGPGFEMLDEELQELFESYFNELGCNENLGEFIINYSTIKENEEYINWLDDLNNFFK